MSANMNYRMLSVLVVLVCLYCSNESDCVNTRFPASKGFLVYRTVSVTRKSCTCPMSFSCSCCQSVVILYTKAGRNLCVNFAYQRNGLNIDVSLDSTTITKRTVTEYKAFMFCVHIPGTLFSSSCINVVELNQFPRSITACLRLDIYSKKKLWQINYDCVSISTELPTVGTTVATNVMGNTTMPTMPMTRMVATMPATMAMQAMMMTMMATPSMMQATTTASAQMNMNIEKLVKEQMDTTAEPMRID